MVAKALAVPPFLKVLVVIMLILMIVSLIDDELFIKTEKAFDKVSNTIRDANYGHNATNNNSNNNNNASSFHSIENPEEAILGEEEINHQDGEQRTIAQQETEPPFNYGLVSIVANLDNDFGKNLGLLAFANILQIDAKKKYNISTKILPMWTNSASNELLIECFPNLDGKLIDELDFQETKRRQVEWLGDKTSLLEPTLEFMEDGLSFLQEKLKDPEVDRGRRPLPYIYIDQPIVMKDARDMEHLKILMKIKESCCTESSSDGETVLFLDGQNDMAPNQTLVFLENNNITMVLIVSTQNEDYWSAYTSVLPQTRVATNATNPLNIYCLLRYAPHEIIGPAQSEIMQWAATFNTKAKRRLYTTTDKAFITHEIFQDVGDPRSSISFEIIDRAGNVKKNPSDKNPHETPPEQDNATIIGTNQHTLPPLGTEENPVSLVIQLSGEMGNQLSKLAWGYGIKWWLEEDYKISTKVILRHQDHSKWIRAAGSTKKCFTKLRAMDFEEGNTEEFNIIKEQQAAWVGEKKNGMLCPRASEYQMKHWLHETLETVKEAIESPDRPAPPEKSNFTLPFLYTDVFGNFGDVNDRYFERLKDLFEFDFDNPDCCITRPEPDEVVFHFRNFLGEMKRALKMGFEESSANKTAYELFSHLGAGDKIAITSRFPDKGVPEYVAKFEERGIVARVISGQSAEHDFCFLMSAGKEFTGLGKSTYATWVGYLGNASTVNLYRVVSPSRRAACGGTYCHDSFNFTNHDLQRRFHFPAIKSEAQDEEDAKAGRTS